jgi:hypothetical protein
MPEGEFWQFIEVLGGSVDEDAVGRLADALRAAGKRKAIGFAARLAATLYELDRFELFQQPVRWADAPDEDILPLSDDSFLYLRAGIVARGKDTVDAVLADPTVLQTTLWDDGEALLYAADEAVDDEIETRLSYETGSNTAQWPPTPDDASHHAPPLVAVLLEDLLVPLEGYLDADMTLPAPPMYAWPMWFPHDVLDAASTAADALVREAGGVPPELDVVQLQVVIGLGDAWQLSAAIEWQVQDDTGLGQVLRTRAQMRQADVRAWTPQEQETGLRAVVATSLLAALPEQHDSRAGLERAVAGGAHLFPAPG